MEIFKNYEKFSKDGFYRYEDYLFKENKLCVPKCSTGNLLLGVAKLRRMMVGISMSFGFFFFFSFSFLVSENSCISFGRWLMVITIMTHLVGGLWYFHKFH